MGTECVGEWALNASRMGTERVGEWALNVWENGH